MWGYVIPVLAVLIIMVNGIIVSILAKPHVRSHTTFILILIAVSDTLNIVFPAISYIYHYTSGRFKDFLSYSSCFWTYIFADVFVDMFNMISLWLTVLLAYIRCRCLRTPFAGRHIHSYKNIVISVTTILVLAAVVHLPAFFLFEFSPVHFQDSMNSTKVVCGISESSNALLKPCMGRKIHILMETIIDSVVPSVILVCCNISILMTLHNAKRERSSLRRNRSASKDERNFRYKKNNKTNVADENDLFSEVTEIEIKPSANNNGLTSTYRMSRIASSGALKTGVDRIIQNAKWFVNFNGRRDYLRRNQKRRDSEIDKLDRESRRTTWLIFVISCMILLHEIPVVVTNINKLVIHAEGQLPLNFYGCFSLFLSIWQYITYPVIFIIYACMSGSFRAELKNTFSNCYKGLSTYSNESRKIFMSPCSVRKSLSRERSLPENEDRSVDSDTDF